MKKGETYLNREILYIETFKPQGTFKAYYKAYDRLKDLGYEVGSMCRNEPIGFADGEKYDYIAKWDNIPPHERNKVDGVMHSTDFREGGVQLIFFNTPKL